MAREPHRSDMLALLAYGSDEEQIRLLREFTVMEAGSSHSDVQASSNLIRLFIELHGVEGRLRWSEYYVGDKIVVIPRSGSPESETGDWWPVRSRNRAGVLHQFRDWYEAETLCRTLNARPSGASSGAFHGRFLVLPPDR